MAKIKSAKPKIIGQEIITKGSGNGKWGKAIQDAYDRAGIITNHGPGCDIPVWGKEIKSRSISTNSSLTIGTHTVEDIVKTNGKVFLDKMNKWDLVTTTESPIKDGEKIVSNIEELDLSQIQDLLEEHLEELANQIKNGRPKKGWAIAKTEFFEIEHISSDEDRYGKLRVIGRKWKKFKSMVKSAPQRNKMFEIE